MALFPLSGSDAGVFSSVERCVALCDTARSESVEEIAGAKPRSPANAGCAERHVPHPRFDLSNLAAHELEELCDSSASSAGALATPLVSPAHALRACVGMSSAALELSHEITYAAIKGVTAARGSALWVIATHGWLALWAVRVSAESAPVQVQLEAAACPSPSDLEDELEPLLGRELDVSDHHANRDARVIDYGATFSVEVAGIQRAFGDVARDCVERARQAAVFITLNLKPVPSEPAEVDTAPSLRLGVQVSGELAYSRAQERVAPGAGAGLWLEYGALRFAFSAAVLFADEIRVRSAEVGGSARLMRVPLAWSGSYQLRLGPLAVGPALGVALDLLHLRGEGVARAETTLRANLGGTGGIDSVLRFSPRLSAIARVGVTAFPRAYSLSIAPLGPGGQTPKLWFSASLGVGWQFGG